MSESVSGRCEYTSYFELSVTVSGWCESGLNEHRLREMEQMAQESIAMVYPGCCKNFTNAIMHQLSEVKA